MEGQEKGAKDGEEIKSVVAAKHQGVSRVVVVIVKNGVITSGFRTALSKGSLPGSVVITLRKGTHPIVEDKPRKENHPPGVLTMVIIKEGGTSEIIYHLLNDDSASGLFMITIREGYPVRAEVTPLEEGKLSGFLTIPQGGENTAGVIFTPSMKKCDKGKLKAVSETQLAAILAGTIEEKPSIPTENSTPPLNREEEAIVPLMKEEEASGNKPKAEEVDTSRQIAIEDEGLELDNQPNFRETMRELNTFPLGQISKNEERDSDDFSEDDEEVLDSDDDPSPCTETGTNAPQELNEQGHLMSTHDRHVVIDAVEVISPPNQPQQYEEVGVTDEKEEGRASGTGSQAKSVVIHFAQCISFGNEREIRDTRSCEIIQEPIDHDGSSESNVQNDREIGGPSVTTNQYVRATHEVTGNPGNRVAQEVISLRPWLQQAFALAALRGTPEEYRIRSVREIHPNLVYPTSSGRGTGPPDEYVSMGRRAPFIRPHDRSYHMWFPLSIDYAGALIGNAGRVSDRVTSIPGLRSYVIDPEVDGQRDVNLGGTKDAIIAAWNLLMNILVGKANWSLGYPHFHRGARVLTGEEYATRIPVIARHVGRLIGDGGQIIQDLEQQSGGATIILMQDSPHNNQDSAIFVYGTVDQVTLARELIVARRPFD